MEKVELPKVPSELIKLAIEDMKKCIENDVIIDMSDWGSTDSNGKCTVCFAGAVMLQRTQTGIDPRDFNIYKGGVNSKQYSFLDYIRSGHLKDAMRALDIDYNEGKEDKKGELLNKNFTYYIYGWKEYKSVSNDEEWYSQLEKLSNDLYEMGY